MVVDLRGAEGAEKMGVRPCLIVQNDGGNAKSPLTIVVPVTDRAQHKNYPTQVLIPAAELGLRGKDSIAECGHIRTIDRDRRIQRYVSRVSAETLIAVDAALKASLAIP